MRPKKNGWLALELGVSAMGVYTMEEQLRLLRMEYNRPSFKANLRLLKGSKCVNCGSEELVEYHHIVPLINGGTNNLSNIVPLCEKCHVSAHGGVYGGKAKHGGRPRRKFSKEDTMYLYMYFHNVIGKKALIEAVGLKDNRLTNHPWYEEYKRKCKAPKDFYNNIDLKASQERRIESRKGK